MGRSGACAGSPSGRAAAAALEAGDRRRRRRRHRRRRRWATTGRVTARRARWTDRAATTRARAADRFRRWRDRFCPPAAGFASIRPTSSTSPVSSLRLYSWIFPFLVLDLMRCRKDEILFDLASYFHEQFLVFF